jgi:hypothetical protein
VKVEACKALWVEGNRLTYRGAERQRDTMKGRELERKRQINRQISR